MPSHLSMEGRQAQNESSLIRGAPSNVPVRVRHPVVRVADAKAAVGPVVQVAERKKQETCGEPESQK